MSIPFCAPALSLVVSRGWSCSYNACEGRFYVHSSYRLLPVLFLWLLLTVAYALGKMR